MKILLSSVGHPLTFPLLQMPMGLPSPKTIMDICSQHLPKNLKDQALLHESYLIGDVAGMHGSEWSFSRQRTANYMSGYGQVDGTGEQHSMNLNLEFLERRSADVAWIQAELTIGNSNVSSILVSPKQKQPVQQLGQLGAEIQVTRPTL